MNFKLRYVVSYIDRSGLDMEKAVKDFFGDHEIYPEMPDFEKISSLFNEWLIFDCKLPSGISVISDYYFKNPDNFSENLMDEVKQIIGSAFYDLFDVEQTNPGVSVTVWALFTGKRYKVYEKSLSLGLGNSTGCFYNRVAKVNGNYYFIGSEPYVYPMRFTDRLRKLYKKQKNEIITPKDTFSLLIPKKSRPEKRFYSIAEIKTKQRNLKIKFEELKKKYQISTRFTQLTLFIFNESYKHHFADFYRDILSLGITEEMTVKNVKFFQDCWNFFPHKKLGGKTPAEMYTKLYG